MGQGRSFRQAAILIIIVVFVLGCGMISQIISPPTPTPLPPTNTPKPPATATPIPTKTPEPSPTPTDTPPPSPTPSPTSTEMPALIESELDNGWYLYTLPGEGFSIALPPDWYTFDVTGEMADAAADFLAEGADSAMGDYYQETMPAMIEQGVKFFAIEFGPASVESGYPASINIIQQARPAGMSLNRLADMSAAALESMFDLSTPVEHETIELTSGTAERLSYGLEVMNVSGEPVEARLYQYMIESEGDIYVITMGALADGFDTYIPTFEQIMDSFRFDKQQSGQ